MSPPGIHLVRLRRACLKAVARVLELSEPTDSTCDAADWDQGLEGALESLPAVAAKEGSELVDLGIGVALVGSGVLGTVGILSPSSMGLLWVVILLVFLFLGRGRA